MKYQISKKKLAELIKLRDHALQLEREGVELPEWETVLASPDDSDEMKAYFFQQDFVIKMVMRRRELNISQEDLAKTMGTTQSVISRFEHFGRKPTLDFMLKLTNALNMKFDFLHENQFVMNIEQKQVDYLTKEASEYDLSFDQIVSKIIEDHIEGQNSLNDLQIPFPEPSCSPEFDSYPLYLFTGIKAEIN
jgi:transcriptional regulator with XRE-family HTH domain